MVVVSVPVTFVDIPGRRPMSEACTALTNKGMHARMDERASFGTGRSNDKARPLPPAAAVGINSIINVKTHTGLFGLAYKF